MPILTAAANEIRKAAVGLTRACHERSLRDIYYDAIREGVPGWADELLKKLK